MKSLKILLLFCIFSFLLAFHSVAQEKEFIQQHLLWLHYYNKLVISDHWVFHSQAEDRIYYSPYAQHQFTLRGHLHYLPSENLDLSVGLSFFGNFPNDPETEERLLVPEWRPHQEMILSQKSGIFSFSHRYQIEERFVHNNVNNELIAGYKFNMRFRYRFMIEHPLNKSKSIKLKLYDEVMINAGKNITNNIFDQNRSYAGIQWKLSKNFSIEGGYMYLIQQRISGYSFYTRHIIRLTLTQNISIKH